MMMQPMEFAILGKNKKEEIFFVSLILWLEFIVKAGQVCILIFIAAYFRAVGIKTRRKMLKLPGHAKLTFFEL